jgi:hypothetical protein
MENYVEQYQAKQGGGVTLHTWTDVQGWKKKNFYITGVPGTPIPAWFREVLRQKQLSDIADFPYSPSRFYE